MLPRTPRLCRTRGLKAPLPLHPVCTPSLPAYTPPKQSQAEAPLWPVVVHLLSCSSPRLGASLLATLTALPASWELPSPLLTSSVSFLRPQGPLCAWSCQIQGGFRGLSPHHGKTTGCPGRDQQGPGLRHLTRAAACREAGRSPGQVGLAAQSLSHVLSQPVLLV